MLACAHDKNYRERPWSAASRRRNDDLRRHGKGIRSRRPHRGLALPLRPIGQQAVLRRDPCSPRLASGLSGARPAAAEAENLTVLSLRVKPAFDAVIAMMNPVRTTSSGVMSRAVLLFCLLGNATTSCNFAKQPLESTTGPIESPPSNAELEALYVADQADRTEGTAPSDWSVVTKRERLGENRSIGARGY